MTDQKDESAQKLGFTELVKALRREVEAAQARFAEGDSPMFVLTSVEAEVNFVLDREVSAGGRVNILFFAVEAKGQYKSENVHKLKIHLEPASQSPIAFGKG